MSDKVILGMPGPWAQHHREAANHYTTKIGGLPDWPFPKENVRADLLQCGDCGNALCLVAQVLAPISSLNIEERVIYVFGCVMPNCGSNPNSWRAIRVQNSVFSGEVSSSAGQEVASASIAAPDSSDKRLENDERGEQKYELENEDVDLEALCVALSKATSLASHSKKQSGSNRKLKLAVKDSPVKPSKELIDTLTPVVPCFYIYSQEDSSSGDINTVSSNYSSLSIKENQCFLDDHIEEETWEGEHYEYDKALYADRTYLKFKKRMDAYPEQCFRYSLGGKPLLASKELKKPGSCEYCGAPRCYEMQLMPPLLYFLHDVNDDQSTHSIENWNWMTLIVYTCSKSCSDTSNQEKACHAGWNLVEEAVIVQFE